MTETAPDPRMAGVIPYLTMKNAEKAVEFYTEAFGATVISPPARDDKGRVMNVILAINGGALMMMDDMPEYGTRVSAGGTGYTMQLVVPDGRMWWDRAVAAGCTVKQEYKLEFWGDYFGSLADPYGIDWAILEPGAASATRAAE